MDAPIYLRIVEWNDEDEKLQNRWYVIEEEGSGGEERVADELGEERWVLKSPKDRVRILDLPDYDHMIESAGFAVANSRLFLVGGYYSPEGYDWTTPTNAIVYIDLQRSDPSWCQIQIPPDGKTYGFMDVFGAVVSDDGEWISAVGRGAQSMLSFRSKDVGSSSSVVVEPGPSIDCGYGFSWEYGSSLLARTETKIVLYRLQASEDPIRSGGIFCYDLESRLWKMIRLRVPWCRSSMTAVVVKDRFLIAFSGWRPWTSEYGPALYVFDLNTCVIIDPSIPKLVDGLPNDGKIFPSMDETILDISLMQVRSDELKLALVWSIKKETDDQIETLVHCSKFILVISEDEYPSFHAEPVSSATFNAGNCFCPFMKGAPGR